MTEPNQRSSRGLWVVALLAVLIVGAASPAHAYLDPATGSYVFQILMAGLLGALFALKMFWRSVRTFAGDVVRRITHRTSGDG
jgi:hypothetical protein